MYVRRQLRRLFGADAADPSIRACARCAIGYVGVYDLPLLSRSKEAEPRTPSGFFTRSLGEDMEVLSEDLSPAKRAGEVKIR